MSGFIDRIVSLRTKFTMCFGLYKWDLCRYMIVFKSLGDSEEFLKFRLC